MSTGKILDFIFDAVHITFVRPILFTLYTAPFSHVIAKHDVEHYLYADDTHIHISLSGSDALESLTDLKYCTTDVFTWMTKSKLKLIPSKTEFIINGSKRNSLYYYLTMTHFLGLSHYSVWASVCRRDDNLPKTSADVKLFCFKRLLTYE